MFQFWYGEKGKMKFNYKKLFYFRKSDRQALLFLLCLGIIAVLLLFLIGGREEKTFFLSQDSTQQVLSTTSKEGYFEPFHRKNSGGRYYPLRDEGVRRVELFPFDPNRADSNQLSRLGFAPWQIRNIYRYRAKGGVYRTPEDLAQLYGMTKEQYETLRPYIRISDGFQPASHYVDRPRYAASETRDTVKFPVKIGLNEKIVLNTADTTQLKKVPGIGSGWARQIVNYGQLLGGYVDVAQLTEIEGFPNEALSYFIVQHPHPHKMNLNQMTLNQLRRHPYINFYQARAICDYRRLKGKLTNLDQLRLLNDFTPTTIERLQPYVEF